METEDAHVLATAAAAIWIPAGLPHRTTLRRVRSVAVSSTRRWSAAPPSGRVCSAATPVIREMVAATRVRGTLADHPGGEQPVPTPSTRWRSSWSEWLAREAPLCLPTSTDPVVQAVMSYTGAHLTEVTLAGVLQLGVSERSLRRKFGADTGMTWREYVLQSRLLRAMVRSTELAVTVLGVVTEVGFDSVSVFTRGSAISPARRRRHTGGGFRCVARTARPAASRRPRSAAADTPTNSAVTTSTLSNTDA